MKYIGIILILTFSAFSSAVEFSTVEVLNGKVTIDIPKNFTQMTKEVLALKYPNSRRPTEVLSDETGGISIAFNHTASKIQPSQINDAHIAFSKMFHNLYPSAKWIRDEVIEQNGSAFIIMELITPAIDTKIHNIIYGSSVDGRLLFVAFNTTVEQSKIWLPIGKRMMSSLSLK
ncbi:MAG: hypothetical protein HRU06_06795 [Oceanospirillaceae bacterium]|nr:hypothetical protein [Oceanospirillaceae bacterium]